MFTIPFILFTNIVLLFQVKKNYEKQLEREMRVISTINLKGLDDHIKKILAQNNLKDLPNSLDIIGHIIIKKGKLTRMGKLLRYKIRGYNYDNNLEHLNS